MLYISHENYLVEDNFKEIVLCLKMAVLVKKTYSKRQEEVTILSNQEKENLDPFDELLSSPLRRDVQFQPLSFWGTNVKKVESKNRLFETSDSDDNSLCRKKKHRWKFSKHKNLTSPLRNSSDLNVKIYRTTRSMKNKRKVFTSHESESFDYFGKVKNKSLNDLSGIRNMYDDTFNEFGNVEKLCSSDSFTNSLSKCHPQREKSSTRELRKNFTLNNSKFKIYEDVDVPEETVSCDDNKESKNLTLNLDKNVDETLTPFHENHDSYKFVNTKRHYNSFKENKNITEKFYDEKNRTETLNIFQNRKTNNENFKDLSLPKYKDNTMGENSQFNNEMSLCNDTTYFNEDLDKTLSNLNYTDTREDSDDDTIIDNTWNSSKNESTTLAEETETMHLLEFEAENTLLDNSQFVHANITKLKKIFEELLLEERGSSTSDERESSFTSGENTSSDSEAKSVIRVPTKSSETSDTSPRSTTLHNTNTSTPGFQTENDISPFGFCSKGVSNLMAEISNLTISSLDESVDVSLKSQAKNLKKFSEGANPKVPDAETNSGLFDLRNVTKRRKYRSIGKHNERSVNEKSNMSSSEEKVQPESSSPERDQEEKVIPEQSEEKTILDLSKSMVLVNPMFESTRVQDMSSCNIGKEEKVTEESEESKNGWMEHSFTLKPGKKWLRSVSVLKQIRNGNVTAARLESSRVKGRKYESFVKDMLEMQSSKSVWSASKAGLTQFKKRLTGSSFKKPFPQSLNVSCNDSESENSSKAATEKSSIFSTCSEHTMLEASYINPMIKVINSENRPSGFSLKGTDLLLQGVRNSLKDESSSISGKDFILLQCGQEDILSFEEHFNENTLKNCRKIGEGVYGEVFMSSDAVIKIIPIEGTEKVNGEPQKTFEEILSEVVIALKLSNLRNGEENRTDCFVEVKRCWCVRGKYPKYLLRLWNEFDQMGSGSENDSPVMFKEDQVYIILELANGGNDLESFVFSSAQQSLSVFIQTAFGLAAAEKALDFEHRDLHWGNLLMSPTKEKYVTVVLENVEYQIPSKGVKVCIIDFTLSRICYEGFCIFNDLSIDPSLFSSEGDYQFEIYRMMLEEVRNDWSLYKPKTNVFWLHYTLDKMLLMVRYKNKKSKLHKKYEKELKILESTILDYDSAAEFAVSDLMKDVLKRL